MEMWKTKSHTYLCVCVCECDVCVCVWVYLSERRPRGLDGGPRVVGERGAEHDALAGHVGAAVQRHAAGHGAAAHAAHAQPVLHAALELLLQRHT